MTNLLLFVDDDAGFMIALAAFFFVVIGIVVAATVTRVVKVAKQQQRNSTANTAQQNSSNVQQKREYFDALREKKYQQSIKQSKQTVAHADKAEDHTHVASEEEYYEDIVGSLGEVNDEGCDDLAGVRLIVHDLAYEQSESERDYTEVAKAIVLGDVISHPRCKNPYKR